MDNLKIIEESDLNLRFPEFRYIDMASQNTVSCFSTVVNKSVQLRGNWKLIHMHLFALFKELIEIRYPELKSKETLQKYQALPSSTDMENIIRESFRIMRAFRNIWEHNASLVSFEKDILIVPEIKRGDEVVAIKSTDEALNLLATTVVFLAKAGLDLNYWQQQFLSKLYSDMLDEFHVYLDDLSNNGKNNLKTISSDLNFNRSLRFRVANVCSENWTTQVLEIERYDMTNNPLGKDDYIYERENS